jgi:hypothetical protein
VRPQKEIFNMEWPPENKNEDELKEGRSLVAKYHIQPPKVLTSCSTCHR